jgi:hypothetical protein
MAFKFDDKLSHETKVEIKNETDELFLNIFGFTK